MDLPFTPCPAVCSITRTVRQTHALPILPLVNLAPPLINTLNFQVAYRSYAHDLAPIQPQWHTHTHEFAVLYRVSSLEHDPCVLLWLWTCAAGVVPRTRILPFLFSQIRADRVRSLDFIVCLILGPEICTTFCFPCWLSLALPNVSRVSVDPAPSPLPIAKPPRYY